MKIKVRVDGEDKEMQVKFDVEEGFIHLIGENVELIFDWDIIEELVKKGQEKWNTHYGK